MQIRTSEIDPFAPRLLQVAYYGWWTSRPVNGISLTVTFMPSWKGQLLSQEIAESTIRHFVHRLNRAVLGRRNTAKGSKLELLAVQEGAIDMSCKRLHYHFYIRAPDGLDHLDLCNAAVAVWRKLDWASKDQYCAKPDADKHWIGYILKLRSKQHYGTAIDINNSFRCPDGEPMDPS